MFTRFLDSNGNWSNARGSAFTVISPPITYAIQAAEYFIDTDPGEGNGTTIEGDYTGTEASVDINIPTNDLDYGEHYLFFRFQDNQGDWSSPKGQAFTVTNPVDEAYTITAAEYFIDTDPGEGNGVSIDGEYSSPEA